MDGRHKYIAARVRISDEQGGAGGASSELLVPARSLLCPGVLHAVPLTASSQFTTCLQLAEGFEGATPETAQQAVA